MSNTDNTARLRQLMAEHKLTCPQVAAMLDRSVVTVWNWRCDSGNNIPSHTLALLEVKTTQRSA